MRNLLVHNMDARLFRILFQVKKKSHSLAARRPADMPGQSNAGGSTAWIFSESSSSAPRVGSRAVEGLKDSLPLVLWIAPPTMRDSEPGSSILCF
jgi:hypothetical protein